MRVEVVRELDPDDPKLEVPWASPNEPQVGYVDLKRFPQKVEEVTECRQFPPIAGLLRGINRPASLFRSAKCDVWRTGELTEDELSDFALPFKVASYVDLLFDRAGLNSDLALHFQLGGRIGQSLKRLRVQAQIEIAVRRCLFHPDERWGYYLTIFVHAYGVTNHDAEAQWNRTIDALGRTLEEIDQTFRQTLSVPQGDSTPG
jgi:hypothetical protein